MILTVCYDGDIILPAGTETLHFRLVQRMNTVKTFDIPLPSEPYVVREQMEDDILEAACEAAPEPDKVSEYILCNGCMNTVDAAITMFYVNLGIHKKNPTIW